MGLKESIKHKYKKFYRFMHTPIYDLILENKDAIEELAFCTGTAVLFGFVTTAGIKLADLIIPNPEFLYTMKDMQQSNLIGQCTGYMSGYEDGKRDMASVDVQFYEDGLDRYHLWISRNTDDDGNPYPVIGTSDDYNKPVDTDYFIRKE